MKAFISRNTAVLLSLILVMSLFVSCGSKKTVATGGKLEKKSSEKVINDAVDAELKYNTLTAKGNIDFKIGSSAKGASATFKIIKDKVMQASITAFLGVEVFRITFTPDSVVLIDRLKKQYIAENVKDSKLMADFDFNYYNLQALLTNQLFVPGQKQVVKQDYKRFNVTADNHFYILQTKDKGDLLYNFAIEASDRIASTLIYNEKKNVTLQWSYNDFIEDNKQLYPTNMNAQIDIANKRLDINISYKKLEIDKEFNIDYSIPSKYTQVDFLEFIGTYIKKK